MGQTVKKSEFEIHCKANELTAAKLEKLMPLVDLIPTLKEIVDEKKSMTFASKKILKIITFLAAAVGLIIGLLELFKRMR